MTTETRELSGTRLLDWCDGPTAMEAEDQDGRDYICDILETKEDGEWFLVVPLSDEQKQALNKGTVDLRSAMLESARENEEWYLSVPQWDFRKPFTIERQTKTSISFYLCGKGYTLKGEWDD